MIKEGISDLFNNLDGSQIHDAERKKPDMREDIRYDFLHTKLGKRSLMGSNREQTRGSPGVRTGWAAWEQVTGYDFTYGNIYILMLLSELFPPFPSPTMSISLFSMSVSPLLPCR